MRVYVFGSGDCGQLGLGEDIMSCERPVPLTCLDNENIVKISAGGLHSLALSASGTVFSWGCNDEKAIGHTADEFTVGLVTGLASKVVQVACGDSISAALDEHGNVYTWGTFRDSRGILGFNKNNLMQPTPTQVPLKVPVKVIGAGANHMLALTVDHELYTWGSGEKGQLGRRILERHKMSALNPTNITSKKQRRSAFVNIACGSYHSLAITETNELYAWGLNNYGQLGLGDHEERLLPEFVDTPEPIIQISAGEHHSLALGASGTVYAFGRGDSGQLGCGQATSHSAVLKKINLKIKIRMIHSGGNHNLAVSTTGDLYSWGYGGMHQLGHGGEHDELAPRKVETVKNVVEIEAGGQHSVILTQ